MKKRWRHKCPTVCECAEKMGMGDYIGAGYYFSLGVALFVLNIAAGWKLGDWLGW
ncbi:MAG: hypothetical protein V3V14_10495 [Saprospiraceae bacterium]